MSGLVDRYAFLCVYFIYLGEWSFCISYVFLHVAGKKMRTGGTGVIRTGTSVFLDLLASRGEYFDTTLTEHFTVTKGST